MIETDNRARQTLEMRRAGVAYDVLAAQLGYTDAAEARAAFEAALEAADPEYTNRLEADRLDRLMVAVWPQALRGDLAAVDRVLHISQRRERLSPSLGHRGQLREAFEASLAAADKVEKVDTALVEAGRTIADRVDSAVALGEGQEVTKALYLLPHMINVLRELLATPAARLNVEPKRDTSGGKLAQLRAVEGAKQPGRRRGA